MLCDKDAGRHSTNPYEAATLTAFASFCSDGLQEDAGHHEKAWAWRLSGALTFLLAPWWDA